MDLQIRRIRTRAGTVGIIVLMQLSILSGCSTVETVAPTAPAIRKPSLPAGPSIARLEDGREGFVISEVPHMDEAARTNFDRAVALLNQEDYEGAIDILEKVIAHSPGVTAPYIDIAIAYRRLQKPEQAEEHLKTALRLVPGHPVACNEYGLLCRQAGRFAEAKAIYEQTLARFPDYYPAHRNLGILCDLYLNDPACALEHYELYSAVKPEDKQVKLWIADLQNRMGK